MDVESMEMNGSKRVFQRQAGGSVAGGTGKVCNYWLQGRCNRRPCPISMAIPPPIGNRNNPKSTKMVRRRGRRGIPGAAAAAAWCGETRGPGSAARAGGGSAATAGAPAARRGSEIICKFFVKGRCSYGESCKFLHSWSVGDDFSLLTKLEGHQKVVTGIALPSGSNKLYSSSTDETVRIWDCESGQPCSGNHAVYYGCQTGGEVGCIISEGPWAVNIQMGTEMNLDGPLGQVYSLAVGNDMLFAGVQDSNILAWKFSPEGNCFQPAASLSGHQGAVVALVVGGMRLYSGSMDGTIRIWDLASLQCIQTLSDHTEVVMSLLCWDQFLLSCSLDRTIKVWAATESGSLEVTYTHNEEYGALVLAGMPNGHGKPVLLCSCNDNIVRLYDLPSFAERGRIFSKEEVRAIQVGPGGLFFTGDRTGELRVWKWMAGDAHSS
ncbi:unnamed protein product [Spirodela intermedia]|uniref:C3H1-type domain-containing protein n=1 Tax=Spirodela intermedia TaxID=51605 RepID=A0A7I8JV55_SPIIN|nr:unnamed protein product [Spirodela intermedia]CAA6673621.1 unnamed protein product [Spirodela intermedia]